MSEKESGTRTNTITPKINNKPDHIFRQSSWENYIPHPSPTKNNISIWSQKYKVQLIILFNIVKKILLKYFPNIKIDWENKDIKQYFSRFIHYNSSKYISPYI